MTDQVVTPEPADAERADRLARLAARRGGRVPNPGPMRPAGSTQPLVPAGRTTASRWAAPVATDRTEPVPMPSIVPATSTETLEIPQPIPHRADGANETASRPRASASVVGWGRRRRTPAEAAKIATVGLSTTALLGMMAAFGIADRRNAEAVETAAVETAAVPTQAAAAPPVATLPATLPPTSPAPAVAEPTEAPGGGASTVPIVPAPEPVATATPVPVPVPVPLPAAVDLAVPAAPAPPAPAPQSAPAPAPQAESSGS